MVRGEVRRELRWGERGLRLERVWDVGVRPEWRWGVNCGV